MLPTPEGHALVRVRTPVAFATPIRCLQQNCTTVGGVPHNMDLCLPQHQTVLLNLEEPDIKRGVLIPEQRGTKTATSVLRPNVDSYLPFCALWPIDSRPHASRNVLRPHSNWGHDRSNRLVPARWPRKLRTRFQNNRESRLFL